MKNPLAIPSAFRKTALAFPDTMRAAIAQIDSPEGAQAALANADVLANYAKRLMADTECVNAIQHGRMIMIARMGLMYPSRQGERTDERPPPMSATERKQAERARKRKRVT